MIYKKLETVSDLIQRNEIVNISRNFLLISTKKDSLCLGIETYFL